MKGSNNMVRKNKWVLVTGGSRGIGACIVTTLAGAGYDVIFTCHDSQKEALRLVDEVSHDNSQCQYYRCDVSDAEQVKKLCKHLITEYGAPYAIINNAGITLDNLLINTRSEDWHRIIATNLDAQFYFSQQLLPAMLSTGSGCIIGISSVAGIRGNIGQTAYSASKAAQAGFTRSLAREVGRFNIRVNSIAPGIIDTAMLKLLPPKALTRLVSQVALGKPGCTEDIAAMVEFLLSDRARYITGQTLVIDGGLSI
jgi:3-oxoacyl-[acyl-carrier protein] reductase